MAQTAKSSVIDAYAPSPSVDPAREIERANTNRAMSRKTQKFDTDRERLEAFQERMKGQGATRDHVEPHHQFVESTKTSSVVEQYAPKRAVNDQGKQRYQQQDKEREMSGQEKQDSQTAKNKSAAQSEDKRSSVVDKYGQSVERTEQKQEKELQEMKDKSPDLAY